MDPELFAKLQDLGLTPDQCDAVVRLIGEKSGVHPDNPATMAANPPKKTSDNAHPDADADPLAGMKAFACDPDVPAYAQAMMAALSAFAADCNKRMGAVEAAVGDMQKVKRDVQAAAAFGLDYQKRTAADHRAMVTRDVDCAIAEGRVEARDRDDKILVGIAKSTTRTFSAGHPHEGKTEYEAWRDEMFARPPSPLFRDQLDGLEAGNPLDDPFVRRAARHLPKLRAPVVEQLDDNFVRRAARHIPKLREVLPE